MVHIEKEQKICQKHLQKNKVEVSEETQVSFMFFIGISYPFQITNLFPTLPL